MSAAQDTNNNNSTAAAVAQLAQSMGMAFEGKTFKGLAMHVADRWSGLWSELQACAQSRRELEQELHEVRLECELLRESIAVAEETIVSLSEVTVPAKAEKPVVAVAEAPAPVKVETPVAIHPVAEAAKPKVPDEVRRYRKTHVTWDLRGFQDRDPVRRQRAVAQLQKLVYQAKDDALASRSTPYGEKLRRLQAVAIFAGDRMVFQAKRGSISQTVIAVDDFLERIRSWNAADMVAEKLLRQHHDPRLGRCDRSLLDAFEQHPIQYPNGLERMLDAGMPVTIRDRLYEQLTLLAGQLDELPVAQATAAPEVAHAE